MSRRLARTLRRTRRRLRDRDARDTAVQASRSQTLEVDRHELIAQGAEPRHDPLANLGLDDPRDLGDRHLDAGHVAVVPDPQAAKFSERSRAAPSSTIFRFSGVISVPYGMREARHGEAGLSRLSRR